MQERSRISVVGAAVRKGVVGMRAGAAGAAAIVCFGAWALAGCGQRGPLVLPDSKVSKSVAHQQASAARAAAAASAASTAPVASPQRAASQATP